MGRAGQGRMTTHQQKKLERDDLIAFRDRFRLPARRCRGRRARVLSTGRRQRRDALPARATRGARRLDAVTAGRGRRRRGAVARSLRRVRARRRRQGDEHDDGLRADADAAAEGSAARSAHRADRGRRGAHVRHGQPVQADRHLLEHGPAIRARRHRLRTELSRGHRRAVPRGGHQRGGRDQQLDRGRDELCGARAADAAVLHLLLDVRLPAGRRPDLGRGRPACARLPARRHGGPHDARRRRTAASGRQQPRAGGDGAELPLLRSLLRVRIRGRPRPRHATDARAARRRLLLRDADERELRAAVDSRRHRGRHRSRACTG